MPFSSPALDTPTIGADRSLRLVYQGRHLVLGHHQIRLLHALWQTACGWLPRLSIPAVLAGVPFVPQHRVHLSSGQHAAATQSLRRLRAQGLIAPTQQGRVALSLLGDTLMHMLVAWTGWPAYWACIEEGIELQRGSG
jgi:hypothetical protein